jgi:rRNA maturation RNase YbeY
MVLNRQSGVSVSLAAIRAYVHRLRAALRLDGRDFNVCFVSGREIERLNATYRGKPRPTDVLSFPWAEERSTRGRRRGALPDEPRREFAGFLGDIVISPATARRNARAAGHSTAREIRWLVLHGLLHLLGHDHEADHGEMAALESALRKKLEI